MFHRQDELTADEVIARALLFGAETQDEVAERRTRLAAADAESERRIAALGADGAIALVDEYGAAIEGMVAQPQQQIQAQSNGQSEFADELRAMGDRLLSPKRVMRYLEWAHIGVIPNARRLSVMLRRQLSYGTQTFAAWDDRLPAITVDDENGKPQLVGVKAADLAAWMEWWEELEDYRRASMLAYSRALADGETETQAQLAAQLARDVAIRAAK